MKYELEIGRGVHLEIAEHRAFWEELQTGIGRRVVTEIYDAIDRIREHPLLFPARYGERRAALTKRFKYKVIYQIKNETTVRILTVRHPRQHPTSWMSRL